MSDRYLKAVLTIIAVELGWIAMTHGAQPVAAQAGASRVIISGVEIDGRKGYLPVAVAGAINLGGLDPVRIRVDTNQGMDPVRVRVDTSQQPLRVDLPYPVDVRPVGPVRVEPGDRPIKTEAAPFTPTQRPGQ